MSTIRMSTVNFFTLVEIEAFFTPLPTRFPRFPRVIIYGLCFNNMATTTTYLYSFSEYLKLNNLGIQHSLSVEFESVYIDLI